MTAPRVNRTQYALAAIAITGIAVFLLPAFVETGFTKDNLVVAAQALGISLFVAPASIYLTLRLSTRAMEEKLDRIAKRNVHSDHPLDAHGISAIFHDRKRAMIEFHTRCKGAKEVDILGVCLPQLASDEAFLNYCRDNSESQIRIAVLDGEADMLEHCVTWFFESDHDGIVEQARGHIKRLAALKTHGVNIYNYNHWPMASLKRVDDVMFYSPYIFCVRGAESPVFRIVREEGKPNDLFDTLLDAFETIIGQCERNENSAQPRKKRTRKKTTNKAANKAVNPSGG